MKNDDIKYFLHYQYSDVLTIPLLFFLRILLLLLLIVILIVIVILILIHIIILIIIITIIIIIYNTSTSVAITTRTASSTATITVTSAAPATRITYITAIMTVIIFIKSSQGGMGSDIYRMKTETPSLENHKCKSL